MKIQYIANTCDVGGLEEFGELLVPLINGAPAGQVVDLNDNCIDFDALTELLQPYGIEVEFEEVEPDKVTIKAVKKFLKAKGY
jgi:hypothetical protein